MATVTTHSERETFDLARRLAARLQPGAALLLTGELGAGKTAFVRGLAAGLGIDDAEVSSPTFTIVQEYRGRLTLYHVDLYRLEGADVDDLGLEELAGDTSIVAIEWAEKLRREPENAVRVRIEDVGGNERRVTIED